MMWFIKPPFNNESDKSCSSLLIISTTKPSFSSTVTNVVYFSQEFGVLDQSNRCNIFFVELIRAVTKIRPSQVSVTPHARIIAQIEADFHYEDSMLINERDNKDYVETKDLKKSYRTSYIYKEKYSSY